jgi:hypothetical protein
LVPDLSISVPSVNSSNNDITLFPNPTTGFVTIQLGSNINQTQSLEIYATGGRVVKTSPLVTSSGTVIQVDLSDLPKGMYLIHLNSDGATKNGRLLIH